MAKQFLKAHRYKFAVGAPIIFLLLVNTTGIPGNGNAFLLYPFETAFVTVGDTIPVMLDVSTKKAVNAVGGTVSFDPTLLSVDSISKDNSIVDLWSEEPDAASASGTIHWSGGIINPDPTAGIHGNIFVINFHAKEKGRSKLTIRDGELLENNGEGTNVLTGSTAFSVYVRKQGEPSPDVNNDGVLSLSDINTLYIKTFRAYDARYDLNNDQKVDWNDVKYILSLL